MNDMLPDDPFEDLATDYLKYRFDGATSPADLAARFRAAADEYDELASNGVTSFDQPVDGGHVLWTPPTTPSPN